MLENRVASPEILAEEAIRKNPTEAYKRMKADQEKITQLQAENKGLEKELEKYRWIPVGERLPVLMQKMAPPVPKKSEEVLATDGDFVCEVHYTETGYWFTLDGRRMEGVTHWMLKPVLPKPKEAEVAQRCCSLNTQRAETEID